MNIMVSELYDALMSAGADEIKARRAAEGIATSDQDFRKQFSELREDNQKMRTEMANFAGALRTEMASLRGELRTEMQGLRTEMQGLRTEMQVLRTEMQSLRGELTLIKWMGGVLIALGIASVLRLYLN